MHENKVELIGTYGEDETHALSAWTSTSRDLTDEKRGRMGKLLKMLAEQKHHSVFEKSMIHFLVTTEIPTHYQILKHRIGVSCITGDTEIWIPKPAGGVEKRTIKDIYKFYNVGIETTSKNGLKYTKKYGRPIPVRSKEDGNNLVVKSYINNVFLNGTKDVFEFETKSGKKIKTTLDHQFYTPDGWQEIGKYIGVELTNGIATFNKKNMLVAMNGIKINNPKKPYSYKEWWSQFENNKTRKEVAEETKLDYNLIKKWGYIFEIKFKEDMNKDFKPNSVPWNKNKYGYKINKKKNGINPNINQNLEYSTWRISVGNWTREQLPKLLLKYNYVCQAQYDICSRDFVCHHIVPVSVDKTLATNIDNIIVVCSNCHKKIHKSREEEVNFASKILGSEIKSSFINREPKKGHKLAYFFDEIIKVKYVGKQDVYDLEIDKTHCYVANGFLIHNCNTESARYKELKDDKFYIPVDWSNDEQVLLIQHCEDSLKKYHDCLARLVANGVPRKRAKESARFYLPYANQLTCDISFNFRSFMHFMELRNSEHAQLEIREIAQKMLELVRETGKFNLSLEAFGY